MNWKTRLLFPFICSSESRAAPTLHKDPLVRETCFIRVYLTFPGMGSNSCAFGCSPCKTLDPGEPWSPLHYCTGQKKLVYDVWKGSNGSSWVLRGLGCWMEAWLLFQVHLQHLCGITLQDYLLQSFIVEVCVRKRPCWLHLEVDKIVHGEIHGVVIRNGPAVQMDLLLLTFNPNAKGLELLSGTECTLAKIPLDWMLGWQDGIKEGKV